jgi:galactonate dehydratase
MNARRLKLAGRIALQSAATSSAESPAGNHDIAELRAWPLREPGSGRSYTVIRLRTKSGLTGWGETSRVSASDIDRAQRAILGRPATAYAVTSTGTPLDPAIHCAMIDITAKACRAPVYRLLGGPTRFKVRALAALQGASDSELAASMNAGVKAGYRAFDAPLPAPTGRNQGQAFDKTVRARMDSLRSAAPTNVDFVLRGSGTLMAGDAASVAASLERFHLLWFDEPCPVTNLRTIKKISDETVTPLGFGSDILDASLFQDLLREGVVDILRPSLHLQSINSIRRISALAETYYVAVAPYHQGGPIATAAALHLAASLPNFFIQHIPWPSDERDRRMRSELLTQPVENVREGFASLPDGIGLGIEVNESALEKYKETAA